MPTDGLICWNCGKPTGILMKVMRNDVCPSCDYDLRCCRGCRHYDPTKRFQCKEHVDAPIPNKEKANFCDSFQMRDAVKTGGGYGKSPDSKDIRKKSFDDLFKD